MKENKKVIDEFFKLMITKTKLNIKNMYLEELIKTKSLFESNTHRFWKDEIFGGWDNYLKGLKGYSVLIAQNKSEENNIKRLLIKKGKQNDIKILAESGSIETIAYEIDKIRLINRFK